MTLYNKYRPTNFGEVMGNEQIVAALRSRMYNGDLPQALLFCGPTGCGKTTLARLTALYLNCEDIREKITSRSQLPKASPCLKCRPCADILNNSSPDYLEINAANARGIDDVRRIVDKMQYAPNHLENRFFIFDECHQWTADAQNCILKPLENPYPNTYIILCTTSPDKLLKTVRGRCEKLEVHPLDVRQKKQLINWVVSREEHEIRQESPKVYSVPPTRDLKEPFLEESTIDLFAEHCSPNPRNLLNELSLLLSQEEPNATDVVMSVLDLETSQDESQAIDFARALASKKIDVTKVKTLCKNVDKSSNFEGMRRVILTYGKTCLVKNPGADTKFMNMIRIFLKPLEENQEADFMYRVHYYLNTSGI